MLQGVWGGTFHCHPPPKLPLVLSWPTHFTYLQITSNATTGLNNFAPPTNLATLAMAELTHDIGQE